MTKATWLAAVERLLPSGTTCIDRHGSVDVIIPCSRGGHTGALHLNTRTAPEHLVKIAQNRGWTFRNGNKKGVCPECNNQPKEETPMPANDQPERATLKPVPATPSTDARQAKRNALRWIGESFDAETGRYEPGITDATIAAEVGLSEKAVVALREDIYGPLKEPHELVEARRALVALRADITKCAATLQELSQKADGIESTIDKLVRSNGW